MKPLFAEEPTLVSSTSSIAGSTSTGQLVTSSPYTTAIVTVTDDLIDKVGERNRSTAAGFSQKLLQNVKASDVEEIGGKLNQLVATAKGLDPSKFAKKGVIGKLSSLFGSVKEKMLAEYQTVETRMDTLIGEIDKTTNIQRTRIADLESMFVTNVQVHDGFEQDIGEVRQMLVSLNAQLEQQKAIINPDSFTAQTILDVQGRVDRAEKKIDDLERAKLLCKQLAPQIRLMQSNARSLTQKFGDVKSVTIPAWKNAFTLYIVQLEQKKGAELANAVHDATDDAFRMQADLLRQNTQEIAKANQRSVVSYEVIEHMQNQLLGSFDDMMKINDDGKRARAEAAPKLLALEKQLIDKFSGK